MTAASDRSGENSMSMTYLSNPVKVSLATTWVVEVQRPEPGGLARSIRLARILQHAECDPAVRRFDGVEDDVAGCPVAPPPSNTYSPICACLLRSMTLASS